MSVLIPAGGTLAYLPVIISGCLPKLNCVGEKQKNKATKTRVRKTFFVKKKIVYKLFGARKGKNKQKPINRRCYFTLQLNLFLELVHFILENLCTLDEDLLRGREINFFQ